MSLPSRLFRNAQTERLHRSERLKWVMCALLTYVNAHSDLDDLIALSPYYDTEGFARAKNSCAGRIRPPPASQASFCRCRLGAATHLRGGNNEL
jgi:hypothetical protein